MQQLLKQLNFSKKEADVYLAILNMNNSSISSIARKAKIKRPNAYVIVENLKEKGLVSLSKDKGKQTVIAQNPDKLLKLIELERQALNEQEDEIISQLPKFEALGNKDTAVPLVKYYQGKENVWNILEDLVKSEQEAWIITPGKIYESFGINRFMRNVINKRKKLGTKANIITDHNPENIKAWKMNESFREYRFMPKEIEMNAVVYIYANKISIIFLRNNLSGITIENEKLFLVFKFMFQSLWKELRGKNLPLS